MQYKLSSSIWVPCVLLRALDDLNKVQPNDCSHNTHYTYCTAPQTRLFSYPVSTREAMGSHLSTCKTRVPTQLSNLPAPEDRLRCWRKSRAVFQKRLNDEP